MARQPSFAVRAMLPWLVAAASSAILVWLAMRTPAFTDYETEAEASVRALRNGDLAAFLREMPAYGGSLVLRAPFAVLANLWGGGGTAAYRLLAVPGLIAAAILGMTLHRGLVRHPPARWPRTAAWAALLLCVANPVTAQALELGHAEELLGGALCAGAALAAVRSRPGWAGLLLGLALANKTWAVAAVIPVLLALDRGQLRAMVVAAGTAGAVLAPLALLGPDATGAGSALGSTGTIFQPWQVWWFLGEHAGVVHGVFADRPGYRTPPSWIGEVSRPALAVGTIGLGALCWVIRRGRSREDAILVLATIMLARCVLDPWNIAYYHLPFLLALTTWEVVAHRRLPVVAATATLLTYGTLRFVLPYVGADTEAAFYLAWSVPTLMFMTFRVLAPGRSTELLRRARPSLHRWLPTFVDAPPAGAPLGHA